MIVVFRFATGRAFAARKTTMRQILIDRQKEQT
jgi:hypothetical protein